VVTETTITTTTTTIVEEKYRVMAPETMQETFMSDSEDEGGKSFVQSPLAPFEYKYIFDFPPPVEAASTPNAKTAPECIQSGPDFA
jgi:hypothetical protein